MEKADSVSSSSSASGGSNSLNGLNFGKKIYFEDVGASGLQPKTGGESAPPPRSPAKKGRGRTGAVHGGPPPRCQVEGCHVDLSDVKPYYTRHKVCGVHSKTLNVIVAGLEQRFCQQCSRFHQLPEFDQEKRSCRRRLAGHNERRRKPQPGSLFSPRYGSLSSSMSGHHSKRGSFTVDFNPSLTGRESWPITPTSERALGNQPPWQSNTPNYLPDLLQGSTTRRNHTGTVGVSSEVCLDRASNSSGALSLLSNQPWNSSARPLNLGINNFLCTNICTPTVHPPIEQYACPLWSFKGDQASDTLHKMPPDLGLGQIYQSSNNQCTGELGLAQQGGERFHELEHSRGYDSSGHHQHVNWSI